MCACCATFTGSCVTVDFHSGRLQPANSHRPAARPQRVAVSFGFTCRVTTRGVVGSAAAAALRFDVFGDRLAMNCSGWAEFSSMGFNDNEHTRSLWRDQLQRTENIAAANEP